MLETIEKNEMVKTREEGYQRVLDTLDGTFAFIDESARVRTKIYKLMNEFYNNM